MTRQRNRGNAQTKNDRRGIPTLAPVAIWETRRNDRAESEWGQMRKILHLSDELIAAIESARGDVPASSYVEQQLWRLKTIRDGAEVAGVENPKRPSDGRGKWKRGEE